MRRYWYLSLPAQSIFLLFLYIRIKEYPYQNHSLQNLKGERWKDIPALEGYFMVSNFGRVRREEYELPFEDGRVYKMGRMIMKTHLAKAPNRFMKDHTFFLRATLILAKNVHIFSVGRLVYHCFRRPFDLEDKGLFVICRDMDGRNLRPSNLSLVTHHGRRMRVINEGRNENVLLRKDIRDLGNIANREKNGKQISRYNRKGVRLGTYCSIPEAAAAAGISVGGISGVLQGRKVTSAGFYWRYGAEKKVDIESFLRKRKETNKCFIGKKVSQYTMKGKKIGTYISIAEASRQSGVHSNCIGKVVNGEARTAGGFLWKAAR